jgi:hypothetical protein
MKRTRSTALARPRVSLSRYPHSPLGWFPRRTSHRTSPDATPFVERRAEARESRDGVSPRRDARQRLGRASPGARRGQTRRARLSHDSPTRRRIFRRRRRRARPRPGSTGRRVRPPLLPARRDRRRARHLPPRALLPGRAGHGARRVRHRAQVLARARARAHAVLPRRDCQDGCARRRDRHRGLALRGLARVRQVSEQRGRPGAKQGLKGQARATRTELREGWAGTRQSAGYRPRRLHGTAVQTPRRRPRVSLGTRVRDHATRVGTTAGRGVRANLRHARRRREFRDRCTARH